MVFRLRPIELIETKHRLPRSKERESEEQQPSRKKSRHHQLHHQQFVVAMIILQIPCWECLVYNKHPMITNNSRCCCVHDWLAYNTLMALSPTAGRYHEMHYHSYYLQH
jgi:hypothetical protein